MPNLIDAFLVLSKNQKGLRFLGRRFTERLPIIATEVNKVIHSIKLLPNLITMCKGKQIDKNIGSDHENSV